MVKAIFLDIDGTLVSFQTHEIPESAVRAIATARGRGSKVFIATGRPRILINNLGALQERGLIDGYFTMNGGNCFVGDEVIYKSAIPAGEAHTLLSYCTERSVPCVVVGEHDICVCHADQRVRSIFYDYLHAAPIPEVAPDEALRGREVFQMTPFIVETQEAELRPHLPHCEIGRWHPAFADITALGNTKQRGIDQVCRHFGIAVDETLAIGDGGNDIPMLRHAGIGVAMGNANPTVQAAADYVTDTVDNDGLAKALQHFDLA